MLFHAILLITVKFIVNPARALQGLIDVKNGEVPHKVFITFRPI